MTKTIKQIYTKRAFTYLAMLVALMPLCGCSGDADTPESTVALIMEQAGKDGNFEVFYSRASQYHIDEDSTDSEAMIRSIKLRVLTEAFFTLMDDYRVLKSVQDANGNSLVTIQSREVKNDASIAEHVYTIHFVREHGKWKIYDVKYQE